ncbi:MAG: succinate dehydrogenase assembly factor 2 [Pseudomonadota bacterium]
MTSETIETRRKRLYMRSIRRGIKEMDVILTAYAGACLEEMDYEALDAYEALITEPDLDIYPWIIGQTPPPPEHAPLVAKIVSKFNELQGASAET